MLCHSALSQRFAKVCMDEHNHFISPESQDDTQVAKLSAKSPSLIMF